MLEPGQQSSRTSHGSGVAGHALRAALPPLGDQPGTLQHGHMFLHGGKRHIVVIGELAHGRVGLHDPRENVPPGGVGEGPEQPIERVRRGLVTCNHLVVDSSTSSQVGSEAMR